MLTKYQIQELMIEQRDAHESAGCFGQVTARRDMTKVQKVSGEDYAYAAFLEFIEEYQGQPFVPKVYAQHIDDGACFVVMESLRHLNSDEEWLYSQLPYRYACEGEADPEDFMEQFESTLAYSKTRSRFEIIEEEWRERILTPEFIEFWCTSIETCRGNNFATDMHANNVMMRETAAGCELVITDPWYDKHSETRNRLLDNGPGFNCADAYTLREFIDGQSYEHESLCGESCKCFMCHPPYYETGRTHLSELQAFANLMADDPVGRGICAKMMEKQAPAIEAALQLFANNC